MDLKIKNRKLVLILILFNFILIMITIGLQAQSEPKGTVKIYGKARYQTRVEKNPIKHAKVKLYEDSSVDTEIGTTTTNSEGYYEFYITFSGSKNVYARIYCESMAARVTDGALGSVYWDRP